MCFSAEADIVAAVVVTGVGVDALRHIGHGRERTLATLPILFGVHQAIEVPVWWTVGGSAPRDVGAVFAFLYLLVAFGLLPWLVPLAVHRLETDRWRRRGMVALGVLGAAVSLTLMVPTIGGPISVVDGGSLLDYSVPIGSVGGLVTGLYVVATCGALVLSSDRVVRVYGAVNFAVVALLAILLAEAVISLWCVWAAVTSIAIAVHLRRLHQADEGVPGSAAAIASS